MATGGFARRRAGGGGGGEATVANIHAIGETRLGIQIALDEGGADWALLVGFRNAGPISAMLDSNAKTVTVLYNQDDIATDVVDALNTAAGVSATLIYGTDEGSLLEPHFAAGRPFLAGEPYGQYAEAYIPAVALFEHPVAATTLFEAVDSGTAGLTVTLDEPLAYGLALNDWAITGHQRYQGTPDTAAQNPSVAGTAFTHARYLGEFTTANLPDNTALADANWWGAYDTTRNTFVIANRLNDWAVFDISLASTRSWTNVFGDPPAAIPWEENGDWLAQLATDGAFEYADDDALNASLGANIGTWQGADYGSSEDVLWFDQSDGDVKIFGAVTPAIAEVKATVDLPTSATGGIRVTHIDADGTDGNRWEFRLDAQDSDDDPPIVIQTFPGNNPPYYRSVVRNGATAQELLEYSEAPHRTDVSAAFYGTETGTTVLVTNGAFNYAALGGQHDFSGGVDAVTYVPPVAGEPEEPIHLIVNRNLHDQSRLTADAEDFPADPASLPGGTANSSYVLPGQYADDAAATAAIPSGVQRVVYYSEARAGMNLRPFRETTDGGATWIDAAGSDSLMRIFSGANILSAPLNGLREVTGTDGAFADAAAAAAFIVTNLATYDQAEAYFYYDQALRHLRYIPPGNPFRLAPAIEIYYNIAAGGRLTGADTLGPIRDFINTHEDGLTAEFVGGADANTAVTRPFANRSQFSGGSLSGLQVLIDRPLAIGEDGNDWVFQARARFGGGAEQSEQQAHILLYTNTSRNGGVRIDLEADIQGLNEHGAPVDVSSGALGNQWTFTAVDVSSQFANVITINTADRRLTYHAGFAYVDAAAGVIHDACNQPGTGCSARYFGSSSQGAHPFDGALGRINTLPQRFHNGRDYHPATANPDPIAVTVGPANATTRIFSTVSQGIEIELRNPAGDAGNGWRLVEVDGAVTEITVNADARTVELAIPTNGSQAGAIFAAFSADARFTARYFGGETGTTLVMDGTVDRREFLGGLDAEEIEIEYAEDDYGAITRADRMGEVKAVIDAVDGLSSYYYGGADANTPADRHTPWEHLFENGDSQDFDLTSFALGPAQNTFTGATRAAAEAARDTYAAANPAWVISYRGNASLWISLRWDNGGQIGQVLRATAANPPVAGDWVDQALALKGEKGDQGIQGPSGGLTQDQVDARIMALVKGYARVGGPLIAPADAADTFMLDAEFTAAAVRSLIGLTAQQLNDLVTGGSISGRTVTLTQADGTTITFMVPPDTNTQDGVLASGSINAAGTELTLTLDTGTDITVDIPVALRMGGGGGITLADVKEFARAGERGVRVGDIDSEGAADDAVITSDGADGAAWEAQQGPPAPTPGMHLRFFGWKAAGAIVTADLDATLARTNSSTTDEGEYPPNNVQATRWFAVPESQGVPTEHYLPPNPLNTIIGFTRQAGTIDDSNGEAHIVMVAAAQTPITANPTDVRIGHN